MPTFTVTRYQTVSVSQDIDIEADTAEEARALAQAAEESEWSTGDIGEPTGEDPDFEVRDEEGELLIAIDDNVALNPCAGRVDHRRALAMAHPEQLDPGNHAERDK
jgi:hypothetical protein